MIVAAVTVLLLAGCAGDADEQAGNDITELPASTVLEKSLAALKAVPSYRVELRSSDERARASTTIAVVGTNLRGTLTRTDGGRLSF